MRRIFSLLLCLMLLLPGAALAEGCIINLVEDFSRASEIQWKEGAELLEIVFPRVYSSDCIIIRYGDEVMMIDASTRNPTMRNRIFTACDSIGVDHIDIAYNSHPHDDHIDGFEFVYEYAPFDKFYITFPKDHDARMKSAMSFMEKTGVPVEQLGNGDVITLGDGAVTMTIIQERKESWSTNDQSAMLMIQYGERRILLCGDNENRSQQFFENNEPEIGLKADIMKYPHHGQVRLREGFFDLIDPELVFMNGAADVMDSGKAFCKKHKVDTLLGYKGLARMRTDGAIWVIDYVKEINADRECPYTPEYE